MTAENAVKVQWDCEHSGNLQFLQSKNLQCRPQVSQPQLPGKLTAEECYTIMDDWASDAHDHTTQFHQGQLERQDQEYLKLVQNSQASKEAEEEHTMWCDG